MLLKIFPHHSSQQYVIMGLYATALLALYFERLAGLSLLVFLGLLGWLAIQKQDGFTLKPIEKNWIKVSLLYASILIASFFVHLPITDDGVWRLSSYSFIILMAGMFYVQSKIQITEKMLFFAVLFSVLCALTVFIIEFYHYGFSLFSDNNIRLGHYASINYGGYANFVMGTLIVLIGLFAFQKNDKQKWLIVALAGLMLIFIMLGRGRTSIWYFSIVVAAMVWHLYHIGLFKVSPKITKYLMGLGILIVSLVLSVTHERIYDAYNDISRAVQADYDSSLGHRIVMYTIGSQMVTDNPLLGVGLNHFKEVKAAYLSQQTFGLSLSAQDKIVGYTQIHNQFLMDAIFAGIFGLISVILFLFYPLWLYIKFYSNIIHPEMKLLALSGILFVGYAIFTSLFGSIFTYTYTSILYMLMNGLLLSYLSQHRDADILAVEG